MTRHRPLILDVDPVLAGHIGTALGIHLEALRRARHRPPAGLQELFELMREQANQGHNGTGIDTLQQVRKLHDVQPQLRSYTDTATVLACSVRQVKRLVADGVLPTVRVRGLVRIRTSDIDAYIAGAGRRIGGTAA
jgi:excisionase family DNA binding protein